MNFLHKPSFKESYSFGCSIFGFITINNNSREAIVFDF